MRATPAGILSAMKDLGIMAAVTLVLSILIFGIVTAGSEEFPGSNTKNGVISGSDLPEGVDVDRNRLHAPDEPTEGEGEGE